MKSVVLGIIFCAVLMFSVFAQEEQPQLVDSSGSEESTVTTILELILNKVSVVIGEIIKYKAYLTYSNNTPLAEKPVDFYAGEDKVGSDVTDESGFAKFLWNTSGFPAGTYVLMADYKGDGVMGASSATEQIVLEKPPVEEELIEITGATDEPSALTTAAIIDSAVSSKITKNEDCQEEQYEAEEKIYGTCQYTEKKCTDEPLNQSCYDEIIEYECEQGKRTVQKTRNICKTKGYTIDNSLTSVKLTTEQYACIPAEEPDGSIVVICDSKFDGNGDGICTSGESCQKFVIDGPTIEKYEKNSREDYVESDDSYFAEGVPMEVLQ